MPLTETRVIIEPPRPPQSKEISSLVDYLKRLYDFNYLMWRRVGGYAVGETGYQNMVYQNSNNITITGGILTNVTIEDGAITSSTVQSSTLINNSIENSDLLDVDITDSSLIDCIFEQGGSSTFIKLGGVANTNTTQIGNSGSSLQNLLSYVLPASSLNSDGSLVEIEAWGSFAPNSNNKRIVLYFGATVLIDTGLLSINSGHWSINATVIRTASTTQKSNAKIISSNATVGSTANIATPAENTANSITIKIMGQGSANNDVVQEGLIVKYFNK